MIQIMFTCDRCKRQRELKKDFGEEDELYDVVIGRHNGFTLNRTVKPTQLCPECKSELEKWLNGKKQTTRTDVSDKRTDAKA